MIRLYFSGPFGYFMLILLVFIYEVMSTINSLFKRCFHGELFDLLDGSSQKLLFFFDELVHTRKSSSFDQRTVYMSLR